MKERHIIVVEVEAEKSDALSLTSQLAKQVSDLQPATRTMRTSLFRHNGEGLISYDRHNEPYTVGSFTTDAFVSRDGAA